MNKYLHLVLTTMLVWMIGATKASAQECFDMTELGQPNSILCVDYDATIDISTGEVIYKWADPKLSPANHPRQSLMTQQGVDPICNKLNILPPDGKPSIRMASTPYVNKDQFAQGEMVVFQTIVDQNRPVILLNFAAMMEPTEHLVLPGDPYGTLAQPNIMFDISIGGKGQEVPLNDMHIELYANQTQSWKQCINTNGHKAVYRDWTTVAFDMSKYIGKQVNVYATVKDCAGLDKYDVIYNYDLSGNKYIDHEEIELCGKRHLARMYCNVDCAEDIHLVDQNCEEGTTTMRMSDGYLTYKWYDREYPNDILGTTAEITFPTPDHDITLVCEAISYTSTAAELKTVTKTYSLSNNCDQHICADQRNMTYQIMHSGSRITSVDVLFSQDAQAAGLQNQMGLTPSATNSITVDLPAFSTDNNGQMHYVMPGDYTAEVVLHTEDGNTSSMLWEFSIYYPASVIGQDWNDVLYIKNANYNGGYELSKIEWYEEGELVEGRGDHNGYYAHPVKFDGQESFWAVLTRKSDGKSVRTCSCTPESSNMDDIQFDITISQNAPGRIHITSAQQSGAYVMYDMRGMAIANGVYGPNYDATEVDVEAVSSMGTYVIQFRGEDGKTSAKKVFIE